MRQGEGMEHDRFLAYDIDMHRYTVSTTGVEHRPLSGDARMIWTDTLVSPEQHQGSVVTPRADAPFVYDGPGGLMLFDSREEDRIVEWAAKQGDSQAE